MQINSIYIRDKKGCGWKLEKKNAACPNVRYNKGLIKIKEVGTL